MMKEFFHIFFIVFKTMLICALIAFSGAGPIVLGATLSPWFLLCYFITIPLGAACFEYFTNNIMN